MTDIKLHGRIFIEMKIKAQTGLHIGGSGGDLEIGGVDNEIIRNPLTKQPYIPGSSFKGKLRSLTEKRFGLPQNNPIGNVIIHTCKNTRSYQECQVCKVFGVPSESDIENTPTPSRLLVRDVGLTKESVALLDRQTELFAEHKTEVAIDRVTSAAVPREIERVPAGAEFGPSQLVFGIYGSDDFDLLDTVFEAMQLVEDDYLGGSGSRGSGQVEFKSITVYARSSDDYGSKIPCEVFPEESGVQDVLDKIDELKSWAEETIGIEE